ncbi:MAG: hypothetical protein DDT22_01281 [candidate division WS2 bacterium]|nr:hypothetical protein [Candidatus Lithacetigena glycinireducens]
MIGAVAAIAIGGTVAYFSDTETSAGNTFTAGTLDLKIGLDRVRESSWTGPFFKVTDMKPGDQAEKTISLHVDNDAWGRLIVTPTLDSDNSCTEPELAAEPGCTLTGPGELRQNLKFWVWLDQGAIHGFQGKETDRTEGDNIYQSQTEPMLITKGPINAIRETTWNLWEGLRKAYVFNGSTPHSGVVADGRMVGSVTYYFGIGWELPTTVGNDVQSDTFVGDMTLQVVQHRNNPDKVF